MDLQNYSDRDWQEILDEFRLLVARAGFADWDRATADALIETGDDEPDRRDGFSADGAPLEQLRRYAGEFIRFLKARSRWTLDEDRRSLAHLLTATDGQPIDDFKVVFDDRDETRSLYERVDNTDAMIEELRWFIDELYGEDRDFWDDGAGADGDDR